MQNVEVLLEISKKQATQTNWMKEHASDLEQKETKVISVARRWGFIYKKLNVLARKLKSQNGQRKNAANIVKLGTWMAEAESFLVSHNKESKTSQEIMKIRVRIFSFFVFLS